MYAQQKQGVQFEEANLSRQIKQYMIGLEEAMAKLISICNYYRGSNINSAAFKQIELMMRKMQFQIEKYKQTLIKIDSKLMTKGGIKNIKTYLNNNYNTIIRECHQLISMCGNQQKQPTKQDFKKIKQFQQQMNNQWNIHNNSMNLKTNTKDLSALILPSFQNQSASPNQIYKMASSQIQQQFLAIRLIAYKMYEKHNSHEHQKLFTEIQTLKQQQNKLSKQVNQMKNKRMGLMEEERRLSAELVDIKKINQLIGRRYFIEGSRYLGNHSNIALN